MHEGATRGTRHPPAIPTGKKGSFDHLPEKGSTAGLIGKAQPAFPVNLLSLEGSGQTVEVADWLHGGEIAPCFEGVARLGVPETLTHMYFQHSPPSGGRLRVLRLERPWWIVLSVTSCGLLMLVSGCEQGSKEVAVTSKSRRELVFWDKAYPGDLKDRAPAEWRRVPWTQMRYYNYRFGSRGGGEIWLSVVPSRAEDSVLQNINRWYNQFRMPEIVSLEDLQQEPALGTVGYLVEAKGTYYGGMGADPKEDSQMLALAVPISRNLVTVKMVGSPAEVEAERQRFLEYCKSLEFSDVDIIERPENM